MKTIVALLIFLTTMFSNSYGSPLNHDKKIFLFLITGLSTPIGDFEGEAKSGFNWASAVELQLSQSWAMGISINGVDFKHKNIYYDPWFSSYTYIDWSVNRVNFWGKYIFVRKSLSPFLKLGIDSYFIEERLNYVYQEASQQRKSRKEGFSIIPGGGFEYLTKKLLIFIEVAYNIIPTNRWNGDVVHEKGSQFFDFLFGAGFNVLNF